MAAVAYSPQALSWRGGELIEARSAWAGVAPYTCTLVVGSTRAPCYGAEAGGGNDVWPSGQYVRCGSPRLPDGTAGEATLEVVDATGSVLASLAMMVAPPFYPTTTYLLRSLCPAVWATGPRELASEAQP